jgi:hypothetical protein
MKLPAKFDLDRYEKRNGLAETAYARLWRSSPVTSPKAKRPDPDEHSRAAHHSVRDALIDEPTRDQVSSANYQLSAISS